MSDADRETLKEAVCGLRNPSEVTTGMADGWDTVAALTALYAFPHVRHQVVCPGAAYNRLGLVEVTRVAAQLGLGERFTVVTLPLYATGRRPADAYRERNEYMVGCCDVLVAGVRSRAFYRSGEHMTVNIAKKRGVRVRYVVLGQP